MEADLDGRPTGAPYEVSWDMLAEWADDPQRMYLESAEKVFLAIGEHAAVVPREADELIADIGEDAFAMGDDGHAAYRRMVAAADLTRPETP